MHRHLPPPSCASGLAHLSSAYAGPTHSHAHFFDLDILEDELHLSPPVGI